MSKVFTVALVALMCSSTFGENVNVSSSKSAPFQVRSFLATRYSSSDQGLEPTNRVLHRMNLVMKTSSQRQSSLNTLLENQRTPGNPNYHKWLTPDEYATRFGASSSAIQQATAWLTSSGMTNIEVSRGHRSIRFSGQVSNVSSAFQTSIHTYSVGGVHHFANTVEPAIPSSLSSLVFGVVGLSDFRKVPKLQRVNPAFTTETGIGALGPADLATIYNIKAFDSVIPEPRSAMAALLLQPTAFR